MSTISVPLTPEIELAMDQMIKEGVAETKAAFARSALRKFIEDQAVNEVLLAQQEIREGKIIHGDIRDILFK